MMCDGYKRGRRRLEIFESRPRVPVVLSTTRASTSDPTGVGRFLTDILSSLSSYQDLFSDELATLWGGASEADEHDQHLVKAYSDLGSLLENPAFPRLLDLMKDVLPKTGVPEEHSS